MEDGLSRRPERTEDPLFSCSDADRILAKINCQKFGADYFTMILHDTHYQEEGLLAKFLGEGLSTKL